MPPCTRVIVGTGRRGAIRGITDGSDTADRRRPDADRAEALRFLVHFVGDVHQPLHATARDSVAHPEGDRGGNDFDILSPPLFRGVPRLPKNLHALWDAGVGLFRYDATPLTAETRRQIAVQAETLTAALPRPMFWRELRRERPDEWAKESFEGAKRVAYRLPENSMPTDAYLRDAQALAARRVVLAGYRLADLINRLTR